MPDAAKKVPCDWALEGIHARALDALRLQELRDLVRSAAHLFQERRHLVSHLSTLPRLLEILSHGSSPIWSVKVHRRDRVIVSPLVFSLMPPPPFSGLVPGSSLSVRGVGWPLY